MRINRMMVECRGISKLEIAKYLGLSLTGVDEWRRQKFIPGPIPGTRRWDKKAIDLALDRASGIKSAEIENAFDKWRRERNKRTLT